MSWNWNYDVDLIAEVKALEGYHALESAIAARGFTRDLSPDAPICRWRIGQIEVDLMPCDERILGFSNRWYELAVTTANNVVLPNGLSVRLISAPSFLATKFEAFSTRGKCDILVSHDFEDIINVIESRHEIEEEIASSDPELADYLSGRFREVIQHPDFEMALPGLVAYDALYDSRLESVRRRIAAIAK